MKLLTAINRACYASCLLAIIGGSFVTIISIWMEQEAVGWKGVSTGGVLIFAALLVLITNSIIGSRVMADGGGVADFLPKLSKDRLGVAGGHTTDLGPMLNRKRDETGSASETD